MHDEIEQPAKNDNIIKKQDKYAMLSRAILYLYTENKTFT